MAPPVYRLGTTVNTKVAVPARICLKRGYRKIALPLGSYRIVEVFRNEEGWHIPELSDGYTYRLRPVDAKSDYSGERISIWQNDLADALYGQE
jgi:hypothetical protein